jgi:hypothetical protein
MRKMIFTVLLLSGCGDGRGVCAGLDPFASRPQIVPTHTVTLHNLDGSPFCAEARVSAMIAGRPMGFIRGFMGEAYLTEEGRVAYRASTPGREPGCGNGYGGYGEFAMCGNAEMQLRVEVDGCPPVLRTVRWSEVEALDPSPMGWRVAVRMNCRQ